MERKLLPDRICRLAVLWTSEEELVYLHKTAEYWNGATTSVADSRADISRDTRIAGDGVFAY